MTDDGWQPNSDETEEESHRGTVGESSNNTATLAQDMSSVEFVTSTSCSSS